MIMPAVEMFVMMIMHVLVITAYLVAVNTHQKPDGTTVTVADQTLVCCGGQAYLPDTGVCCGGEWKTDSGVCCDGSWIEGGECCDDSDCASKSCDNGVIPVCKLDTHLCDCPPCKSSEDCAEENACCAHEVDSSRGDCVSEGTIIGKYLCDRPEWVLESSLLFKLANENPFSIAE